MHMHAHHLTCEHPPPLLPHHTTPHHTTPHHTAAAHSVEYSMSYLYHSMSAYFDRDDVGLPGFAAYFRQVACG